MKKKWRLTFVLTILFLLRRSPLASAKKSTTTTTSSSASAKTPTSSPPTIPNPTSAAVVNPAAVPNKNMTPMIRASRISLLGVLEASMTVLLTTFEDSIWLIPFVAHAATTKVAIFHGTLFVLVYVVLASMTCLVSLLLQERLSSLVEDNDSILQAFGAALSWCLAAILYYREWRNEQERIRLHRTPTTVVIPTADDNDDEDGDYKKQSSFIQYGSMMDDYNMYNNNNNDDDSFDEQQLLEGNRTTPLDCGHATGGPKPRRTQSMSSDLTWDDFDDLLFIEEDQEEEHPFRATRRGGAGGGATKSTPDVTPSATNASSSLMYIAQPWTVITLTCLGAFDEMSYFPALIVGEVFSAPELCIGTLLASLVLLAGIEVVAARLPQCFMILENLPVYAIVTIFAFVLSLQVVWVLASDAILDRIGTDWQNQTLELQYQASDDTYNDNKWQTNQTTIIEQQHLNQYQHPDAS